MAQNQAITNSLSGTRLVLTFADSSILSVQMADAAPIGDPAGFNSTSRATMAGEAYGRINRYLAGLLENGRRGAWAATSEGS